MDNLETVCTCHAPLLPVRSEIDVKIVLSQWHDFYGLTVQKVQPKSMIAVMQPMQWPVAWEPHRHAY